MTELNAWLAGAVLLGCDSLAAETDSSAKNKTALAVAPGGVHTFLMPPASKADAQMLLGNDDSPFPTIKHVDDTHAPACAANPTTRIPNSTLVAGLPRRRRACSTAYCCTMAGSTPASSPPARRTSGKVSGASTVTQCWSQRSRC